MIRNALMVSAILLALFQTLSAKELDSEAQAHAELAESYYARGLYDEAIREYEKAIEIEPNCARAYNSLGVILFGKGRVEEALQRYRKAIEIAPGYWQAHFNLGRAYSRKGQFDLALAEMKKAYELKPDEAAIKKELKCLHIYRQMGKKEEKRRVETEKKTEEEAELPPEVKKNREELQIIVGDGGVHKRYVDVDRTFRLVAPSGWRVEDKPAPEVSVAFTLPGEAVKIEVSVCRAFSKKISEEEKERIKKCVQAQIPGYMLISEDERVIDGEIGYRIVGSFREAGFEWRRRQVSHIRHGRIYEIAYTAPLYLYQKYLPAFRTPIVTFVSLR